MNTKEIHNIWQNADAVCFDVDSTVIQEEGIDELAKFCGKYKDISELTSKAMCGKITFQQSLKLRLDILQPSVAQVSDFISNKPPTLSPGIKKLIEVLHKKDVEIYLVSGGFRSLILPLAKQLYIPESNVFANQLKFYYTGKYAGYDEEQPTSKSGGKGVVIDSLKKKYGYQNLVMIGDGITDWESCPPADAFIGYGGNVLRKEVMDKSLWYIMDFNELLECYTK
ncbi:hypothetical protein FQA39_LY15208 [Lamprigera yunnana]|nr:hypothetical protein FQA39_LY15208 [Lamprigera yunnana]